MKTAIMVIAVSTALCGCITSERVSKNFASGVIGCSPGEITIVNETATFDGMHNFEAICKGKRFVCSYQATTGINCKEALN